MMMRTTLAIDDDILLLAKRVAKATRTSTGHALSVLARRGYHHAVGLKKRGSFTVFDVVSDDPIVAPEAEDDDAAEFADFFAK
jgi:hypothetical protein